MVELIIVILEFFSKLEKNKYSYYYIDSKTLQNTNEFFFYFKINKAPSIFFQMKNYESLTSF